MNQIITRNGLPQRHLVEGFATLCVDEVGLKRIEDLRARYVGTLPDIPEVRAKLRKELMTLIKHLKYEGHLFRKDGEAFL